MTDLLTLQQIVEQAFTKARQSPDVARWQSCAVVAGCAAVRFAIDGQHYIAAQLEGVAEEARRQQIALERAGTEVEA